MLEADAFAGIVNTDATGDQHIVVVLDGAEVVDDRRRFGLSTIPREPVEDVCLCCGAGAEVVTQE